MKKRGNREGSIRKRADGRWESRATLADGKRRSFYGTTRDEVRRKLSSASKAADEGLPVPGDRLTLGRHLELWLEDVRPEIRYGTWRRYEEAVRLHLRPALGNVPLVRLTPDDVRSLLRAKLAEGMAAATVKRLRATLRIAIQQAVRDGKVGRNSAALTRSPKANENGTAPRVMRVLARHEAHRFLEAARSDRLEALFVLALATGMRRGELLALKWADVDLKRATLRVVGTMQRTSEGLGIGEVKTDQSRRAIQLPAPAVEALRRHRVRQFKHRRDVSEVYRDEGLVFCNDLGGPIEAGNLLRRHFWPILASIGLAERTETTVKAKRKGRKKEKVVRFRPLLRFHDLRHTAATLLLETGTHPSVVAAMLGHSKTSTTLNIYSHVTPSIMGAAARAMEAILA